MDTTTDQRVEDAARKLGAEHGKDAASWYDVGDELSALATLLGIEEGDPEVLDTFPFCDLSGQWADVPSGPQVVREVLQDAGVPYNDGHELTTELLDAYEQAYTDAVMDEIARMARYQLED